MEFALPVPIVRNTGKQPSQGEPRNNSEEHGGCGGEYLTLSMEGSLPYRQFIGAATGSVAWLGQQCVGFC